MLDTWPRPLHPMRSDEPCPRVRVFALLARLSDRQRIEDFAAGLSAAGLNDQGDDQARLAALRLLTPPQAGSLLARTVAANATEAPGACADLLRRAVAAGAGRGLAGRPCAAATPRA